MYPTCQVRPQSHGPPQVAGQACDVCGYSWRAVQVGRSWLLPPEMSPRLGVGAAP